MPLVDPRWRTLHAVPRQACASASAPTPPPTPTPTTATPQPTPAPQITTTFPSGSRRWRCVTAPAVRRARPRPGWARDTAIVSVPAVKAARGRYRMRVCVGAQCRSKTVALRRAGKLPALKLSAALSARPARVTVAISRRSGRAYTSAILTASATISG